MDEAEIREKMQQVVDLVQQDVNTIRTGRINTSLVDELQVLVYGGQQKLKVNELATISLAENQIIIDPWDKSIVGEIRQGILAANVGLNPVIDGQVLRITIPPLTTEDREKYTRLLSGKLESGRVMVRQVRSEAMKAIRDRFENKELSEDEKFNQEKKLQEITDDFIAKIEEIGTAKKQELLQI